MDLDRIDSDLIDDVIRMPGWALIEARLKDEAHRKMRLLIDTGDSPDVTRGFIQGLETAMKIPSIIAKEGREKKNGR